MFWLFVRMILNLFYVKKKKCNYKVNFQIETKSGFFSREFNLRQHIGHMHGPGFRLKVIFNVFFLFHDETF